MSYLDRVDRVDRVDSLSQWSIKGGQGENLEVADRVRAVRRLTGLKSNPVVSRCPEGSLLHVSHQP